MARIFLRCRMSRRIVRSKTVAVFYNESQWSVGELGSECLKKQMESVVAVSAVTVRISVSVRSFLR